MTKPPVKPMSSFALRDRANVGVLIGLAGVSGTGKTLSADRLARGLATEPGEDWNDPETLAKIDARVAIIDTENERALHYFAPPGTLPTPWVEKKGATFRFQYAGLTAPFSPKRYQELIEEADKGGAKVIIIDSFSHEWDGEGGCHDMHDAELDRLVADALARAKKNNNHNAPPWWNDVEQRDKNSLAAWKPVKKEHKRLVGRLLQCKAHVIICMRAEDKMRIDTEKETRTKRNSSETYEVTKTKITAPKDMAPKDRWQPVCEKRLPYELLTSLVLAPDRRGIPYILKLEEQHAEMVREDRFLDEATGYALAQWARGATKTELRPNADQKKLTGAPSRPNAGHLESIKEAVNNDQRADVDADDFPGDRDPGAFTFTLVNNQGKASTTTDGDKWADALVKWLTDLTPERAEQCWKRNREHYEAAEKARQPAANRVWAAAEKRGLLVSA